MKKIVLFIAAVIAIVYAAYAQKRTGESNQPDEKIIVNKEFDEQGNLLRYDSTYSFQWFYDTTFTFPGFRGWEDFFNQRKPFPDSFLSDSIMKSMPLFRDFPNRFFSDDWQPMPFRFGFPDSSFIRNFSFQLDTSFFMGPDSSFMLPPGFIMPNMRSLRDFFNEFGDMDEFGGPILRFFFDQPSLPFDRFMDKDNQHEWNNLMEKHRRELEELYRKWEEQEQKKVY